MCSCKHRRASRHLCFEVCDVRSDVHLVASSRRLSPTLCGSIKCVRPQHRTKHLLLSSTTTNTTGALTIYYISLLLLHAHNLWTTIPTRLSPPPAPARQRSTGPSPHDRLSSASSQASSSCRLPSWNQTAAQHSMAVDKAVAAHANWKGRCRNQAGRKK